jgi:signal peptidase I
MAQHHEKKKQTWQSSIFELVYLLLIVFLVRTFGFGLYQVPTGSMETTMLIGERFFADKLSYNFRKPRYGEIIAFNGPEFKYSSNPLMRLFQRYVWGPDNWTKRVIGVPGDTIRGVIENGKPVVYRNDVKLDEPYINKYPLICLSRQTRAEIEKELQEMARGYKLDQAAVEEYIIQRLYQDRVHPRSYDSSAPYDKQPFYDIDPDHVIYDKQGNPELVVPGTPVESRKKGAPSPDEFTVTLKEGEYWCMGDNRLGSHDCRFFGPIKEQEIHGRIVFRIWSIDSYESWWIVDLIKHPINFWQRVRWSRFFQIMT